MRDEHERSLGFEMVRCPTNETFDHMTGLCLPFMVRRVTDNQVVALMFQRVEPVRRNHASARDVFTYGCEGYRIDIEKVHPGRGLQFR